MATMLVTINISKGWDTWSKMAKDLEPQMNEVGSKIGYSMASHFISAFKKKFGTTPKQYILFIFFLLNI